jgi:hypothetical protein
MESRLIIPDAISFHDDPKQAALYFNRVLPVFRLEEIPFEAVTNLLHGADTPPDGAMTVGNLVDNTWLEMITWDLIKQKPIRDQIPEKFLNTRVGSSAWTNLTSVEQERRVKACLLAILYMTDVVINESGQTIQEFIRGELAGKTTHLSLVLPEYLLVPDMQSPGDITLELSNIPLVDTSKATWDQIIDLRRDKEMHSKLRNLKLFLTKNYVGKSRSFIEDDFGRILDDYERSRKAHGFETRLSVLSHVVSSKWVQTSTAASIALAFVGEPLPAAVSGISAGVIASFELLRVGIEFAKGKHTLRNLRDSHDLAYIITARETLAPEEPIKTASGWPTV